VKYRKDIPQHRLYFHEYAPPDKIAYKVRQVVDWLNGPEPKKMKNALRVAARVHFDLLRIFPFQSDSGKVSRLIMNVILMRAGYPPAIIHSTERQKYYEALKSQLPTIITMMNEAISNALLSIEKRLEEYEAHRRPGGSAGGADGSDDEDADDARPDREGDESVDADVDDADDADDAAAASEAEPASDVEPEPEPEPEGEPASEADPASEAATDDDAPESEAEPESSNDDAHYS